MFLLRLILIGGSCTWLSRKSVERALGRDRRRMMIRGSSWSSKEELELCPEPLGTLRVRQTEEVTLGEMITVGVGECPRLPGLEVDWQESTELCRLWEGEREGPAGGWNASRSSNSTLGVLMSGGDWRCSCCSLKPCLFLRASLLPASSEVIRMVTLPRLTVTGTSSS